MSGRKYSHINSYISVMTVIVQDDLLTAGAWAACGSLRNLTPRHTPRDAFMNFET